MRIGERIRMEREKQGISQNQLAKKAGISQSGLSAIENSIKNPSMQTISAIMSALGVSLRVPGEEEGAPPTVPQESRATSKESQDPDIRRLERAKRKMPEEEWQRMMKIAVLGFEKYFQEDD